MTLDPYAAYALWKSSPNEEDPLLSVVVPAYNEQDRIIPTVGAIAAHVSTLGIPWELIVADDGSSDDTVRTLRGLGLVNARVLETERNGGKGSAVRRGILAARGDYILFSDADNSTPIEELAALLAAVRDGGYDVAIGSRAADGAREANRSAVRQALSDGLRLIVRHGLAIPVRDTQCGFKLFTREAARRLFSAQTIDGFSFDLEILYLASRAGFRIAEIPVQWVDAPGSKVDTRREIQRFLRDLSRIRLNELRGVYRGLGLL